MQRVLADLATRPAGTRSVVLAHAFVVGAVAGGSERSIAVGGVESVTAEVFDGVDYVALGHLHRPQVLSERVRYSGSPMPYAFSETGHRKSVWLIDIDASGAVVGERLPLPLVRPLATVRGLLAELAMGGAQRRCGRIRHRAGRRSGVLRGRCHRRQARTGVRRDRELREQQRADQHPAEQLLESPAEMQRWCRDSHRFAHDRVG